MLIYCFSSLIRLLFFSVGGGFGAIIGQTPQLVHLTEKGKLWV